MWGLNLLFASGLTAFVRLHREILAYVNYISPTEREHRTRAMIVTMITECIQSIWRDAVVQPFGSFETGLYLPLGYVFVNLILFGLLTSG